MLFLSVMTYERLTVQVLSRLKVRIITVTGTQFTTCV